MHLTQCARVRSAAVNMASEEEVDVRRKYKYQTDSAKKTATKQRRKQYDKTRVSLLEQWARWSDLKKRLKMKRDADLAKLLLER